MKRSPSTSFFAPLTIAEMLIVKKFRMRAVWTTSQMDFSTVFSLDATRCLIQTPHGHCHLMPLFKLFLHSVCAGPFLFTQILPNTLRSGAGHIVQSFLLHTLESAEIGFNSSSATY